MRQKCKYYCYKNSRNPLKTTTKQIQEIKLVFFDMDGVLTDTLSSWKFIHDYFGTSNERSVNLYLRGKIDDLEFIKRDVSLWRENGKLTNLQTLQNILSEIQLMPGAKKCIQTLQEKKIVTAIVSAGLDILAGDVAKQLGINYVFANGVHIDSNGRLTGEGKLQVKLMHKDENVRELTDLLKIPLHNTAAVGNSCFDIPMFQICGLGIAFNPDDPCVTESADTVIYGKDLQKILTPLQPYL